MYEVWFNGVPGFDVGVLVVKRPDIPAPEREREEVAIPGRDGVLMSSKSRLLPITISIEMNFMSRNPDNWGERFRKARKWISGSGKLVLGDDASYFYRVYDAKITSSERTSKRIGRFTAEFYCDPYNYLAGGEWERPIEDCLYNPHEICHPLYTVTASGNFTLTVNGKTFTGNGNTAINTDLQTAYNPQTKAMKNTTALGSYEDLYLQEGENTITISGGTMKIVPRWRAL